MGDDRTENCEKIAFGEPVGVEIVSLFAATPPADRALAVRSARDYLLDKSGIAMARMCLVGTAFLGRFDVREPTERDWTVVDPSTGFPSPQVTCMTWLAFVSPPDVCADSDIVPIIPVGSRWRHRKGGAYQVLAVATEEATGMPVVVYCADADGHVWTWQVAAFADGRFERLADAVVANSSGARWRDVNDDPRTPSRAEYEGACRSVHVPSIDFDCPVSVGIRIAAFVKDGGGPAVAGRTHMIADDYWAAELARLREPVGYAMWDRSHSGGHWHLVSATTPDGTGPVGVVVYAHPAEAALVAEDMGERYESRPFTRVDGDWP